jgi:hypothetical protein
MMIVINPLCAYFTASPSLCISAKTYSQWMWNKKELTIKKNKRIFM